jgi:nucleoside-diphosphate-sugar epimerase
MSKLIFGCGYLGRRVAERWRDAGEEVFVVTRDGDHARGFAKDGFKPVIADVVRPHSLVHLPAAETVLYAVGHDRKAGRSIHEVFVGGLKSVLAALPSGIGKVIYVSSTGVYAQSSGEWVDEDSPCEPKRNGALACLAAERALAAHALGKRGIVLRMAGLYGPGRILNAAEIRLNQPIAAPQDGFLNLIHVDDAASVVLAAAQRAATPRTYVVADGHPVERQTYYQELARLLHAPEPKFTAPPDDSPASVRATSSKRVRNVRMLAELGVTLKYSSYREGLAAIVAEEQAAAGSR